MYLLYRLTILGIAFGGAIVGCRCEEAPPPPPPAAEEAVAAEPIGPPIAGWYCEGDGEAAPAPSSAFRVGATWARKGPHWEDPPDESARFINTPGVRDL